MSAAEARALDTPETAAPKIETPGAAKALSLVEAMSLARRSVALFTELKVDSVATCEKSDDGWRVVVDVVEAAARMGDNDLLASYEVIISAEGEVARYGRTGRYRRDDAARGG